MRGARGVICVWSVLAAYHWAEEPRGYLQYNKLRYQNHIRSGDKGVKLTSHVDSGKRYHSGYSNLR